MRFRQIRSQLPRLKSAETIRVHLRLFTFMWLWILSPVSLTFVSDAVVICQGLWGFIQGLAKAQ